MFVYMTKLGGVPGDVCIKNINKTLDKTCYRTNQICTVTYTTDNGETSENQKKKKKAFMCVL